MTGRVKFLMFAFVVLSVASYAYFVEYTKMQKEVHRGEKVFGINLSQVRSLEVVSGSENLKVVRRGQEEWQIVEPIETPASSEGVEEFLNSLLDARATSLETGKEASLADFGLEEPLGSVRVTSLSGQSVRVVIGKLEAVGSRSYAQIDGTKKVLVTEESWDSFLSRRVLDLRDRRVVAFSEESVEGVKWTREGQSYEVTRKGSNWSSSFFPIDQEVIESLIVRATEYQIKNFFETSIDPTAEKVWDLGIEFSLRGKDAEKIVFRKLKGGEIEARSSFQPFEFIVTNDFFKTFDLTKEDLRDRQLPFIFDREDLAQISIKTKEGEAHLRLDKGVWTNISQDDSRKVDAEAVETFIANIEDLRASHYHEKESLRTDGKVILRNEIADVLLELSWEEPKSDSLIDTKVNSSKVNETLTVPTSRLLMLNPNNLFKESNVSETRESGKLMSSDS